MGNKFIYTSCLILILFTGKLLAAGDPEAGAQKVQSCGACHGPNGNSMNPVWPSLAGQHEQYLVKQLKDFKSGARTDPQMAPMAASLSEQDMEDIAAYYAEQELQGGTVPASVEFKLVELGEGIYRAGDASSGLASCMACHSPTGAGNPVAMYPRLNSQHAAYTAAQLQAFKSESRANDINGVMRDIAGRMSNEEIEA
ncbi:MAG: c-type cytochrome, partial [Gammaproteobacteria bacterium]